MYSPLNDRQKQLIALSGSSLGLTEFEPCYKARAMRLQFAGLSASKVHAAATIVALKNMGHIDETQCNQLVRVIVDDAAKSKNDRQFSPPDMQRISALEAGHKPIMPKLLRDLAETYSVITGMEVKPHDLT